MVFSAWNMVRRKIHVMSIVPVVKAWLEPLIFVDDASKHMTADRTEGLGTCGDGLRSVTIIVLYLATNLLDRQSCLIVI